MQRLTHVHPHTHTHARTHARTHVHRKTETETERQRDRDRETDREDGSLNKNSPMATDTPMYTSIHTPMHMHTRALDRGRRCTHTTRTHANAME